MGIDMRWLSGLCVVLAGAAQATPPVERIRVPEGFQVSLVTDQVPGARALALGEFAGGRGVVYVGSRSAGKVYGVQLDGSRAVGVHVLARGLDQPAGVAWHEGSLYVSAMSRILALDGVGQRLEDPPSPRVVTDRLPAERHHGWKFIAFGPDGRLYVPVGAPCNVCERDPDLYASIQRMNPDGSAMEVVARGVRNTVGFDWHPEDRRLWFTDNGRDMLGDDLPADELNRVDKPGQHFGFPYCHQGSLPDPELGPGQGCQAYTPPVVRLGAHVAALGMRFYTGSQFPSEYRHNVFIAEHGSWNRSRRSGYRVTRVEVGTQGKALRYSVFAEGWLQVDALGRERVWGRPADVLVLPDGALLVSDDQAGALYRISYTGRPGVARAAPQAVPIASGADDR
ncbi:PQQ-dependent sugar dehydrogenase [Zoogloea sp.]|uniref:PQQ-dependent sugar dehydrogenase n=1 Tax=Zoogloea sp. TaxID=49181 RepID=UPI00261DCA4F|nr:PQQ-dependent sugar dehydrogenase [Zoogloea sp.]MDD3355200.1 PQQ-dependent sugar dehydrogenase [Zoogloea sp.]